MTLPTLLAEDFEKFSGRPPEAVARALYNLDGTLGATWMATDGFYLVFYYKPSGGNYCRKAFSLSDALRLEAKTETCFAVFRVRFPEAKYELRFSLWDISVLDKISRYYNPDKTEIMGVTPKELSPVTAFCAGIHAILQADAETDEAELEWLSQRVPDQAAIQEGGSWLATHGREKLLERIPEIMSVQQRECLLANMITAAMSDGVMRTSEQEALDSFCKAMQVKPERYQYFYDALLVKNHIGVIIADAGGGLLDLSSSSPIVIFAACLLGMSEVDEEKHSTEEAYLKRLVAREEIITESVNLLEFKKLDGLIESLPGSLNPDQTRCLLANLLGLAMVDGQLNSEEQELIGRFQKALQTKEEDFMWFLEVLLAKNNLTVLVQAH